LLLLLFAAIPLQAVVDGNYVLLSWNDLGMHCMNKDHNIMTILPPYNTLYAQVIQRGDANSDPELIESGVTLEYSIPGNTYSVGKTQASGKLLVVE